MKRKIRKDRKNNSPDIVFDVVEIYVLQVVAASVVPKETT